MKKVVLYIVSVFFFNKMHAQVLQSITTANQQQLLKESKVAFNFTSTSNPNAVQIKVDATKQFQKMEGFGYALTGGSAQLIHSLAPAKRATFLQEVFSNKGMGVSYIRVSMGASDLDATVFSYDDLPKGATDTTLQHFSLSTDTLHLIPILNEALKVNPKLKIMASPWSPPLWMKTNGASMGGHLLKQYYSVYANYFVKYIQAMNANGITIHSVTIQNEPEHGGNNPSMLMDAQEQTEFVRDYLGPQFKAAHLNTEIVIWDHNADHPIYPITILNDAKAKSYIAASAFHMYLGNEIALSQVHDAHPRKKIYFTEQWTGAKGDFDGDLMWHLEHIVLGTIQNWSSMVLEWNLAADANYAPHTPGGCTECKGAFTINNGDYQKNVSYYIIAQIAKYVGSGANRTSAVSTSKDIMTVSFNLTNGKNALIVLNKGVEQVIQVNQNNKNFTTSMPAKSAASFVWQ